MNDNNTVALVGGSGLGPWAWERVTPILTEHGRHVITPQFRTSGDRQAGKTSVTLDNWIEDLSAALADYDGVTVVAHSFAGYVAAAVLERHPRQIKKLIYIDAVLPQPGKSWFEVMGPEVTAFMMGLAQDGAIPWFSKQQLDQLYPEHGITHTDFTWMQSHLLPQPVSTYTQSAIAKSLDSTTASVAYVQCINTYPSAADLTDFAGWDHRILNTGHWPMITNPAETAQVILELSDT
ncbi:MAG: alpha/beta fold hydrolase [Rhodoglobus sp.]